LALLAIDDAFRHEPLRGAQREGRIVRRKPLGQRRGIGDQLRAECEVLGPANGFAHRLTIANGLRVFVRTELRFHRRK